MKLIAGLFITVASSYAFSVQTRDVAKIQQDLKTADSDTQAVLQAVRDFNNGLIVQPIQPYITKLMQDFTNCTMDAQGSDPIPSSQQLPICNYINSPLYNDTNSMLDAFIAKRSQFFAAGLKSTIHSDLQQLQNLTITCIQSINAKIMLKPTSNPCSASMSQARYKQIYSTAISQYS